MHIYDAVVAGDGWQDEATRLADAIGELTGKLPAVRLTGDASFGREILLGETDRALTAEAVEVLGRSTCSMEVEWDTAVYLIYARGGSVAVVWNKRQAARGAVEGLIDLLKGEADAELCDGVIRLESFSYIKKMEAEEALAREAELDAVERAYDKEVRKAVERHLAIYGEEFYLWVASLYDPGEYDAEGKPLGGGFYHSCSARDYPGFYIDIESTAQAVYLLGNLHMTRDYKSYEEALPKKMQGELVAFAQSLQSPEDGYFYHPQWGRDIPVSRLSRDLGWATTLLDMCGTKPLYDAPNGKAGLYGPPPGVLRNGGSDPNGGAPRTAWPDRLATLEGWREYLDGFRDTIRTRSYRIGNTVSSQNAQILAREREAILSGELVDSDGDGIADCGYVAAVRDFFNEYQLPNGLWEEGSVEDGTVTYAAVNGLMKISVIYSGLGLAMRYPEAAFRSALYIAMLEGPDCQGVEASAAVYIYNAFTGMINSLDDIKKNVSEEKHGELRALLASRAAELIRITTAKAVRFKKADGSFGYRWGASTSGTSQGVPVSVPGINEGMINGGGGAYSAVSTRLFALLGIDIRLRYQSDYEKFLHAIEGAVHRDKSPLEKNG